MCSSLLPLYPETFMYDLEGTQVSNYEDTAKIILGAQRTECKEDLQGLFNIVEENGKKRLEFRGKITEVMVVSKKQSPFPLRMQYFRQ